MVISCNPQNQKQTQRPFTAGPLTTKSDLSHLSHLQCFMLFPLLSPSKTLLLWRGILTEVSGSPGMGSGMEQARAH